MSALLQQVLELYPAEVRIVHKDNPIPGHPLSRQAAVAALAAGKQNKYWEYHDLIMKNISNLSPDNFLEFAAELGLDRDAFRKSLADPEHEKHIEKDMNEAVNAGVTGSPGIFINGQIFTRGFTLEMFKTRIDEELKKKKKK